MSGVPHRLSHHPHATHHSSVHSRVGLSSGFVGSGCPSMILLWPFRIYIFGVRASYCGGGNPNPPKWVEVRLIGSQWPDCLSVIHSNGVVIKPKVRSQRNGLIVPTQSSTPVRSPIQGRAQGVALHTCSFVLSSFLLCPCFSSPSVHLGHSPAK